jgi:hypothetical protein
MKTHRLFPRIFILLVLLSFSTTSPARQHLDDAAIRDRLSRLATSTISADTTRIGAGDRKALRKLLLAATLVDSLFLRQVWNKNEETRDRLVSDTTAGADARLRFFNFNMGPWSRADGHRAFLPGIPKRKPLKANLYPDGMKRSSWGTWFLSLNDEGQQNAMGKHHVVRWDNEPGMKTVPYSEEYIRFLEPIAGLLREASALTSDSSTRRFLAARADAFLSNNYRESDIAWLSADGPIDVTIGPNDPSLDELFFYKTGFEAYVGLRNEASEKKLLSFSRHISEIASLLPMDSGDSLDGAPAGTVIGVADAVYLAGGARAGYVAGAVGYPPDTALFREYGDKKIIYRNIQKVKFDTIQSPMARLTISPDQVDDVTFEAYFDHMLMHELAHRLGPYYVHGTGGTVRVEERLGAMASAFEEAKADLAGLWAFQQLGERGTVTPKYERAIFTTHLSSMIRALRFGMVSGPGFGTAIEYNFLKEQGAFTIDPSSGLFIIDYLKFKDAVSELLREILTLQAEGDGEQCRMFYARYAFRPAEFETIARAIDAVPYAVEPVFPVVD